MGNSHVKPHSKGRNKKQVHWRAAERPSQPGRPILAADGEIGPDLVTIRWEKPVGDGGSPVTGYLVEHRRLGSPHWVRATPLLVHVPEVTLSGLEPGWRYQFRVSAENAVGLSEPSEMSDPITVTLQRSAVTAPRFTQELMDATALENEKAEFAVHFLGQPPPKVCWFKDGFEIFSSRRIRIITEHDHSILTFHQCSLNDEGEIKCTATNRAGHVSSRSRLTVEAPPSIRLPRQYDDGLLFEMGEMIRLKVTVAGRPTPLVFWTHNGESIQNDDRYEVEFIDKSLVLKVGEARRSDRGEYSLKAVNKLGEDSASFLVTVTDKPSPPGKARVVMTLGRSVTLSWTEPEDDGGCKIGNYIVEYYRLGWNVWLKAATSRKLSTVLGDLIEGSEYKFRIKAESPYGVSDPSDESEVIFVPDPKRGIVQPPHRGRSQPKDILEEINTPVAARRKNKPRSQSSSRVEEVKSVTFANINSDIVNAGIPKRPQRTKTKTPPKTPEFERKQIETYINRDIFDRSSMSRELAYGSPEIPIKGIQPSNNHSISISSSDRSRTPSPTTKPPRVTSPPRSPINPVVSPVQSPLVKSPVTSPVQSPIISPVRSPLQSTLAKSPVTTPVQSPVRSPLQSPLAKSPVTSPVQSPIISPVRSPVPSPVVSPVPSPVPDTSPQVSPLVSKDNHQVYKVKIEKPSDVQQSNTPSSGVERKSRSPSPKPLAKQQINKDIGVLRRSRSPSPGKLKKMGVSEEGSTEFMLVLYADANQKGQSENLLDFDYSAPPTSLSAPELGAEPPPFFNLRQSSSSTEILHERAMLRLYQAAEAENAELEKRNQARRPSLDIPKIQINSQDTQDIVGLEKKHSFRRKSSGGISQQLMWAQRRNSLRNQLDLKNENISNDLRKIEPSFDMKKEIKMLRQRSESEEKEEAEFEKVRQKMKLQNQLSFEKKKISVSEEERWHADYEESLSESESESVSSEEKFKFDKRHIRRMYSDEDEEEDTYRPRGRKNSEPFEILTKPRELPDPNFVPKPILKKKENGFSPPTSPSVSPPPPQSPPPRKERSLSPIPGPFRRNRSKSLAVPTLEPLVSSNENLKSPSGSRRNSLISVEELTQQELPKLEKFKQTASLAPVATMTVTRAKSPLKIIDKKEEEEERRVVADHYADIVRNYGQKKRSNPQIYLDRDQLKRAAVDLETPQAEDIVKFKEETKKKELAAPEEPKEERRGSIFSYIGGLVKGNTAENKETSNVKEETAEKENKEDIKSTPTDEKEKSSILNLFGFGSTATTEKSSNENLEETQPEKITTAQVKKPETPLPPLKIEESAKKTEEPKPTLETKAVEHNPRPLEQQPSRALTKSRSPTRSRTASATRRPRPKTPSVTRQPAKSPGPELGRRSRTSSTSSTQSKSDWNKERHRKVSPSPMRKSISGPWRDGSESPEPIPFHKRRPMLKEIMTQTSQGFESFSGSISESLTPIYERYRQKELEAEAEVKVRGVVDYLTDLAMFAVACWLYLFKNELLAIPVLLVMVYRQLEAEVSKRIPKWVLKRFQKKED